MEHTTSAAIDVRQPADHTHGVKPWQSAVFDFPVKGMLLVQAQSGICYTNSQSIGMF